MSHPIGKFSTSVYNKDDLSLSAFVFDGILVEVKVIDWVWTQSLETLIKSQKQRALPRGDYR